MFRKFFAWIQFWDLIFMILAKHTLIPDIYALAFTFLKKFLYQIYILCTENKLTILFQVKQKSS